MATNLVYPSKKRAGWPTATAQGVVTYRLIVVARLPPSLKGFGWDIIRQGCSQCVAERSTVSYRSMHEAYLHGAAALERFPQWT
jgi:hypothetical protein